MSSSKTTTSSSTVTPTNPEWVTQGAHQLSDLITNLAAQGGVNAVAPATPLTSQMFDLGGQAGTQGANALMQAANLASGTTQAYGYTPAMSGAAQIAPVSHAGAASALGGIAGYLNPYTSAVTDATLQGLNQANQMALNDVGNSAILAGQYGGSRQGVAQALTNSQFQQNAGSALANLNLQGFNTAAQLSNQDADRSQQASIFNAGADNAQAQAQAQMQQQTNLANQNASNQAWQYNAGANDQAAARQLQAAQLYGNLGQYGLGYLGNAAGVQQGIAQAQAAAPYSTLQQLASAYSNLPLSLFHGQTSTGSSNESSFDPFGNLVDVGKFMASIPK